MSKFLKRLVGIVVIAGTAGGIMYLTSLPQVQKQLGGRRGGKAAAGDVVPVVVADAQRKDVAIFLEGVGSAKARNSVTVKPQVDGKILSINFREGQDVRKGDVLAKIDPVTYQAQLDQALAKKAVDEALLSNARLDYERYNKVGPNIVTQKQIDTQKALVVQYTAQIKQDEAAIASAQAILGYTDVIAPFDGRTGIRLVDVGTLVRSGDAGLVTVTEVKPISVLFTLPQQELGRVNTAMAAGPVAVQATDSDAGKVLDTGTLHVVDNQVDPATGTIRLKAEFPNASLQLWPGQFVNVRVRVDTLKQVVVVPAPAVQRGPSGTYVYEVDSDKAVMKPVTVAQQTDKEAVLSQGVEPGRKVVVNGFVRLRDGAKVSIDAGPASGERGDKTSEAAGASPSRAAGRHAAGVEAAPPPPDALIAAPAQATESGTGDRPRGEGRRGDGRRKRDASAGP